MNLCITVNPRQPRTTLECRVTNGSDTWWYDDGDQTFTIRERRVTNGSDTWRYGDGGQTFASRVFASLFQSDIYILNGRKAVT